MAKKKIEKKSDSEQLKGILEQFQPETVIDVVKSLNLFEHSGSVPFVQAYPVEIRIPSIAAGMLDPSLIMASLSTILMAFVSPPFGATAISLERVCRWTCLGKGNKKRHIQNNGPGKMEVAVGSSETDHPTGAYTRLRELDPGNGTDIDDDECRDEWYIWVHHSGGKRGDNVTGWTATSGATGISLETFCKWNCLGKGNVNRKIKNNGPGKMEVAIGSSPTNHPSGAYKVLRNLDAGNSTDIDNDECRDEWYIWVHNNGGGKVTGTSN